MTGPYPFIRSYDKEHSRTEDEKLANELFFGTSTIIDKRTGRCRHDYLTGSNETRAIGALQRLLLHSSGDLNPEILGGLLASLDPGGSFGQHLVFKRRKRKRPVGATTDLQIFFYVQALERAGEKNEAAVRSAMEKFELSRNAIYEARARIRRDSPWLEESLESP
jgi:hypothetical protein